MKVLRLVEKLVAQTAAGWADQSALTTAANLVALSGWSLAVLLGDRTAVTTALMTVETTAVPKAEQTAAG